MTSATNVAEDSPRTSPLRVGAALGGIVLAAVVVFGLGVMVGKRVTESIPPAPGPPAALPTESLQPRPPAAADSAAGATAPERLTFYDRLSGAAPPAPVSAPDVRPPAAATAARASAPAAALVPAAAAAPPKTASSRAEDAGETGEQIKRLAGRGRYAVQVASVNDRAAAEETAARLKRQGFEVVTVTASIKGRTWHRIRVGSFPSQQAAAKAAALFVSGYGFNAMAVHE